MLGEFRVAGGPKVGSVDAAMRLLRVGEHDRPLFVICEDATGATPALLSPLCIPDGVPVYGLSAEPVFEDRLRTVQGMAGDVLQRLRTVQGAGPYRLAGLGVCGLIAYEVGIQLLGADEQVELVTLVDTDYEPWADRRARTYAIVAGERDAVHPKPQVVSRSLALHRSTLDYEVQPALLPVHVLLPSGFDTKDRAQNWDAVLPNVVLRVGAVSNSSETNFDLTEVPAALSNARRGFAPPSSRSKAIAPASYSSLVTIQAGRRGIAPIFCVPGAGAGVTDFISLASTLGDERPCHGFQPRGMDGKLVPHSSVEAAACAYLKELEAISAYGKIHLIGHSFGGWVAFEMALRLQASGRSGVSLTLLDSDSPYGDGRVGREYTRCEALMNLTSLYEQAAGRSLDVEIGEFAQRSPEAQLSYLHERLVRRGLMPFRSVPESLRGTVRTFEAALRTRYRPQQKLNIPVRLVLVPGPAEPSEVATRRFDAVVGGWRRFADALEWRRGAGNHVTLLKPPNVAGLVTLLADDIGRGDANAGSLARSSRTQGSAA